MFIVVLNIYAEISITNGINKIFTVHQNIITSELIILIDKNWKVLDISAKTYDNISGSLY